MTDEQLEVAARHEQWHADKFGYERKNTEFRKGFPPFLLAKLMFCLKCSYIEKLDELGLEDNRSWSP